MPSQNRKPQPSLRLPEEIRAWVLAYAPAVGRSVNSVVTQALTELRARTEQAFDRALGSDPAGQSLPAEEQADEENES